MRLIDADALIDDKSWDADTRCGYVQVVDVSSVEEAPTIKALPMKWGWETASDGDGVVCPCCGSDFCTIAYPTDNFRFCPICGRKMYGPTPALVTSGFDTQFNTLREIVEQLAACGYKCKAGPLENNEAFIALRAWRRSSDGLPRQDHLAAALPGQPAAAESVRTGG